MHTFKQKSIQQNTPSPRIAQFPLVGFPLTWILAYVCAKGGIPHYMIFP